MGIPDHPICLLRNMYPGQEATVRTRHETRDLFRIGKRVLQGCILSPYLFNLQQGTSYEMLGWMKHKLESRLPGKIPRRTSDKRIPPLWWKGKKN